MSQVQVDEGRAEGQPVHPDHLEEILTLPETDLKGLRALVLGGTGLVGSHIVRSLLARGCVIRVLSRTPDQAPALDGLPVETVRGDLSDGASIDRALEGVDLLFHAAAPYPSRYFGMRGAIDRAVCEMEDLLRRCADRTPPDLRAFRPTRSRQSAIEQAAMAAKVIHTQPERIEEIRSRLRDPDLLNDAARGRLDASLHPPLSACAHLPGLKRVVYTSSVTTIGRPKGLEPGRRDGPLADEGDRYDLPGDPSPYFRCKRLLEEAATRAGNEGLPIVIVNPTLVVDEGDAHRTTGRLLVPIAEGRMPFTLPGAVDAIAGTDVGEGHLLAAMRGRTGQRYILSHERMRLRDFQAIVAQEAGVAPPRIPIPLAVAEPLALLTEAIAAATRQAWPTFPVNGLKMLRHTSAVSGQLAVEELGLRRTPVRDAIRRALDWYRDQGMLRRRAAGN